jgi:hypothetical protein
MGLSFPLPNPVGVTQGGTGTTTQFTQGSIVFAGASGTYAQDNTGLSWDATNRRLGIGTATPLFPLHSANAADGVQFVVAGITKAVRFGADANGSFMHGVDFTGTGSYQHLSFGGSSISLSISGIEYVFVDTNGRLGLGTPTPASQLDLCAGTLTFSNFTTVQKQSQADLVPSWVVSTDATRTGRLVCEVYDTAAREVWRGEASGTAPKIGFLGAAAAIRQVSGAALTNSVTAGGTTDTIANYTSLTTYSTDAAAIRNNIYQLARKIGQINDALRLYGLLT